MANHTFKSTSFGMLNNLGFELFGMLNNYADQNLLSITVEPNVFQINGARSVLIKYITSLPLTPTIPSFPQFFNVFPLHCWNKMPRRHCTAKCEKQSADVKQAVTERPCHCWSERGDTMWSVPGVGDMEISVNSVALAHRSGGRGGLSHGNHISAEKSGEEQHAGTVHSKTAKSCLHMSGRMGQSV